jgi:hypothetical protein
VSNLSAIRARLIGAKPQLPRVPRPYDHLTKAAPWAEVERLRTQLREASRVATVGRNAITTIGHEGTAAFRPLTDARAVLREVCALVENRSRP